MTTNMMESNPRYDGVDLGQDGSVAGVDVGSTVSVDFGSVLGVGVGEGPVEVKSGSVVGVGVGDVGVGVGVDDVVDGSSWKVAVIEPSVETGLN